ncbi:filamentous hemagglutinin family protein [Sphingomonas vulcanisoli]|uniref:Filamentous hemagglutinin family protein n=1 Tax=Sphingomonas vulcanisoli TaxID=1658060 RepID=A0ABX0TMS3_9SPHN|nr:filamentous hemagglutinin N-terminal domain-containing protein [Sphingomonas vulcanisoli]NIJ06741.1 filamentous hemagglutinin family protein [Sphingomonas vulcanisoli]
MAASAPKMRARWLCSAACAGLFATAGFAQEVPSGGQVVAGSASIGGSGANLAITQGSSRAVIDWKSFGIGAGGKVTIAQPDANSALLNRVTGGDISKIAGSLTANGQVFLVNRNGIVVTPTGTIDARGGFIGSTLDISNDDFMAGRLRFAGSAGGLVLNQGRISGGAIALLGAHVGNEGLIVSSLGKVALGSGDQATLDFSGDGYLQVLVPADLTDAGGRPLVSNSGRIEAPGGIVMLSAATARAAVRQAVNMSGVIAAKSVSRQGGVVVLDGGSGGRVTVSGDIDASGADDGGRIDITGGDAVALTGATLTAAGGTQGGLVRIGGMFQGGAAASQATAAQTGSFVTRFGALPTLAAADTTNFDAASTIDVSGGANGGTAIVWSNLSTNQAGQIRAGGSVTGGSVELSSHGLLTTSLPRVATGLRGALLLDPKNISVLDDNVLSLYNYNATTLPADGNVPYSAPGADPDITYFKTSDIIGLMNAGTDVVLRASNDIGWGSSNAAVDFNFASSGHSGNLTLSAGRSVTISGYLTLYSSSLTVIANDSAANGVIDADRDPGAAYIETFNSIISAQTGSGQTPGNISFTLGTGAGLTNHAVDTRATGNRLGPISGGNITLNSSDQNVTWAFFPATGAGQTAIDPVNVAGTGAVTITGSLSGNTSGGLTVSGSSVNWTDEATAKVTNGYSGFVAFVENGVTTRWGQAAPVGGGGGNFTRVSLGKGSAYSDISYGDANPVPVQYHITSGALRGTDTLGTLSSAFTGLTTSGLPAAYSAPGTYTITTTAAIDTANAPGGYFYNLTTTTDTIHINPKALLPTVTNGSYTYGAPAALVTLSGVLNNDVVAPVATLDTVAGTTLSANGAGFGFATLLGAGNHSFTLTGLSGAGAGNYTLDTSGLISGTIAIARKALTYQIYDSTTNYGTLASPSSLLNGIVGSDNVSLATLSSAGLSTSARVGTYTVSGSGLAGTSAANYDLSGTGNIDGTLTIQPKPITYVATGGTSVYGDIPTLAVPTLTGLINGDQSTRRRWRTAAPRL